MATPTRRRLRGGSITSNLDALRAQPALHLRLDGVETLFGSCLEPHHDHGLGVRGANKSPAVAEEDAHTIDGDHLVPGGKVPGRLRDDSEFFGIWAIHANLGSRNEAGHIGEQLADAFP